MCSLYETMLDPTRVSYNQLQVQLKARMLKRRMINERVQTGLYTCGGMCGWKGRWWEVPVSATGHGLGRGRAPVGRGVDAVGDD
jgi:hypothetical protein